MVRHSCMPKRTSFPKGFIFLSLGLPREVGCWRCCKTPHGHTRGRRWGPMPCSGLSPTAELGRMNPDSSQRFKFFSLCEIFHIPHRQGSLALGWFPWGWMGKLHSSRTFYYCLLYFGQTAFLWLCAHCQWVSIFLRCFGCFNLPEKPASKSMTGR